MSARDRRISKALRHAKEWHAMLDRPAKPSLHQKASEVGRIIAPLPTYITRAFETFNLNPKKSKDWEAMVWELAPIIFSEPGNLGGRGRVWNADKLRQLLLDFQRIKSGSPNLSDITICEKLIKHKEVGAPYRSRNQSGQTLRRRLAAARMLFDVILEAAQLR